MKNTLLLFVGFLLTFKIGFTQFNMLDSAFGDHGIVKTDLGEECNYYFGYSGFKVLSGSDGSIFNAIEVNSQTLIIKRFADGSVDLSYGKKGISDVSAISGRDAVMQADGKIVVVGSEKGDYYSSFAVARYNTDGSLDNTFHKGGKQTPYFTENYTYSTAVALQNDGKIVVAGYDNANFALVRLHRDGSLDSSFSEDGRKTTDFGFQINLANSVNIQNDGKIVVAGSAWNGTNYDFALARYNTDGSLDKTFSDDGKKITSFGGYNYAYSAVITQNGKILVAGSVNQNNKNFLAFARYNTNGSLDSSFDGDGKKTIEYSSLYSANPKIALQADGKIVMGYYLYNGSNFDFAVSRFNSDGSPDKTFSNDGTLTTDIRKGNDYLVSLTVQKDGKILVTGGADSTGTQQEFALARYYSNGTLDKTFDKDGKLYGKLKFGYTSFEGVAVQNNGKIVAAGYTWKGSKFDSVAVRYNTNGSFDSSFSGDGSLITLNNIAFQTDGKKVIVGTSSSDNYAVARYNKDGSLDKSFGKNGTVTGSFGQNSTGNAVAIQPDGKIVITGNVGFQEEEGDYVGFGVARYTSKGKVDTTFGNRYGYIIPDFTHSTSNAIAILDDGKILTGGTLGAHSLLTRLTADGLPDSTFGNNGKQIIEVGQEDAINDMQVAGSAVYAVGYAVSPGYVGIVFKFLLDENKAPSVSITAPANNAVYLAETNIKLTAIASDSDGTISKVAFYNGNTLLHTETAAPYGFLWKNVPVGNYTLTAKATDNSGNVTTSAAVHISVVLYSQSKKTALKDALSLRLSPNPATSILNIYSTGLQQNKPATLSIISVSGIVLKTMHISKSVTQVDISQLVSGVYTMKIISGDKVMYKQFVKL